MKRHLYGVLCCTLLSFAAQAHPPATTAYWTVETGRTTAPYSIIRFYSADHRPLMEKKITGKKLQICRPAIRRQLNRDLERFLRAQHREVAFSYLHLF